MELIGLALFVFILLAQLSRKRTVTPLQGRPFEGKPAPIRKPAVRDTSPNPIREDAREQATVLSQPVEKKALKRVPAVMQQRPQAQASGRPSLHSAVIWSEILNKPVSKRKRRAW